VTPIPSRSGLSEKKKPGPTQTGRTGVISIKGVVQWNYYEVSVILVITFCFVDDLIILKGDSK
jgi:hypothetical protein